MTSDDLRRRQTAKITLYTRNGPVTAEVPTECTDLTASILRHTLEITHGD